MEIRDVFIAGLWPSVLMKHSAQNKKCDTNREKMAEQNCCHVSSLSLVLPLTLYFADCHTFFPSRLIKCFVSGRCGQKWLLAGNFSPRIWIFCLTPAFFLGSKRKKHPTGNVGKV